MAASQIFLKKISLIFSLFFGLLLQLEAEPLHPINKTILEAISSMPHGGGYSTSTRSMLQLQRAVLLSHEKLTVCPEVAEPSFCSEATYLLFLKTLLLLQDRHQLSLQQSTWQRLMPHGDADGDGIWGRWNANGPGTAKLFWDAKLGKNFCDLAEAEPGDFLKIFWTDAVGATEHGHLVIYLGHEVRQGIEMIHFWSSNQHVGYSDKWVPHSVMKHLLFSRLTNPEALNNCDQLPHHDPYLASLLSKTTTWEEVKRRCGIVQDKRITTP